MKFIVYKAINSLNGSEYIGITKRGLPARIRQHLSDARRNRTGCRKFWRALRKYGPRSFRWEIIAEGLDRDAAIVMERALIAERKPRYNITVGGDGVIGVRLSKARLDRKLQAIRNALQRPILCIDEDRVFSSRTLAAGEYGTSGSAISKALRFKGRFRAGGHYFAEIAQPLCDEELTAFLIDEIRCREQVNLAKPGRANSRAVVCLSDGREFHSASAAAKNYGLTSSTVVQACTRGRAEGTPGLRFQYADSQEVIVPRKIRVRPHGIAVSEEAKAKIGAKARARGISDATRLARIEAALKPVLCVETDTIYPRASAAAADLGLHIATIKMLASRGGYSPKKNLTFKYV